MEIRILGSVELARDGDVIPLDMPKQRAVLATLAVRTGSVVSLDELVSALWGEHPPATAIASIRSHVSRLRRVVGDGVIVAQGPGYVLDLPGDSVDAWRFEALVRTGQAALDDRDPFTASTVTAQALDLWRGTPLSDLAEGDFRTGQTTRLEELHRSARELWAEAELALGHHEMLVGDLERAVAEEPLSETRWAQLMLALYRSGRQADALRAYRRLRVVLGKELGIEPSHRLARLERRILSQDPQLDLEAPAPATNLPTPVSSFVGREHDVGEVVRHAGEHRLVSLIGPGGVGKTRLALTAAPELVEAHPDGVWWVDLALVGTGRAVLGRVAATLRVVPGLGSDLVDALVAHVRFRDMVLVLDNCEHVVTAVAELMRRLLEAAPDLKVITTSRQPLGLVGECRVPVGPMELAPVDAPASTVASYDAVRLFLERVTERSAADVADDELGLAAEMCRSLEGMPLAIELAAARVPDLGLAGLVERLEDRLDLLDTGDRVDPRHASLRAALDWSYQLLDPPGRALFDRLAVFPGDFDLDAAVDVGETPDCDRDVIGELISHLVETSMVIRSSSTAGEHRFRLLETMREYGLEHLREQGLDDLVGRRYADHYRGFAREVGRSIGGGVSSDEVYEQLDVEDHNLRAAVAWSLEHDDPATTLEFANVSGELWYRAGVMSDTVELLDAMLDGAEDAPATLRSWALYRLVWPTFLSGDMARALAVADDALSMFQATGDVLGTVAALASRAHMITLATGDLDEALPLYEAALDASTDATDVDLDRAMVLTETAQALAMADRPSTLVHGMVAAEMLETAERIFRDVGCEAGLAHNGMSRWIHALATDDDAALGAAAAAGLRHARAANARFYEQVNTTGIAVAHLIAGNLDTAELRCLEAAQLAIDEQNLVQLNPTLQTLAAIAAARGDSARAARLWGAAARFGPPSPLTRRTVYQRYLVPACASIDTDLVDAEIEAGRHLEPQQALDLAFA